jgi:sugar phosphate isomerase/epimerase
VQRASIIDPVHAAANLAYSHRVIDAAAELGSGLVSFGLHRPLTEHQAAQLWFWTVDGASDALDDAENWNLGVSGFQELGRHAAELGLQLSLEMYEDTYLGTADSAVRFIQDIGLDNVGLNPDIGNLVRLHRPIESWQELVEKTVPYANYWHIKNYFRDEDTAAGTYFSTPAPLALGMVDYRWAIKEALRAGFTGTFVCEHYGGDGLGVAAMNQDYIRSLLPVAEGAPRYHQPTLEGEKS